MASNKSKQQVKIWLKNVFTRSHNSRSDRGKRATTEGEKAMTENGYKSDVYADDFGDNQGGTKKTVMCIIAILISIGILVYYHHGKKGASVDIAKTEVLDLDTTVVQVAQVPQQVQEKKKQHPVQQKAVTVSKQQAAPAPEPEKPTTAKDESKAELKYAPNGEVLIEKPAYPKNGFGSIQERENYFNTLEEYRKQQRRISDWKIQHDID